MNIKMSVSFQLPFSAAHYTRRLFKYKPYRNCQTVSTPWALVPLDGHHELRFPIRDGFQLALQSGYLYMSCKQEIKGLVELSLRKFHVTHAIHVSCRCQQFQIVTWNFVVVR